LANKCASLAKDRMCIVPSRQTVPNTISTKGPASDRGRRGGRGGIGENAGVVTGLDIFHLARRGWFCALHGRTLHCRRRRSIWRNARWQRPDMSL